MLTPVELYKQDSRKTMNRKGKNKGKALFLWEELPSQEWT